MKRLLISLTASLGLLAGSLHAQTFPTQPVRWIVPYSAGGGTDTMARTLAEAMQVSMGQAIVIDNRPGAATNIAVGALLQAKPDGYTVMQAENAALLFNEHLFGKLPYKPDTDFTYIAAIGRVPVVLVVHPDFPAKTLAEFIAYAKAHPDKLDYASPGVGTPHHMAMELFKQQADLKIVHVPYKGAAPALQDVMGGQVKVMMLDMVSGLAPIKSGKVRALAVALPQRANAMPDLPTFAEQGVKGVDAVAFHGLIGPTGMAPDVVAKLNAELNKAMTNPKVIKLFTDFGFEATPGTPAEFRAMARNESARWGKIIKASGVQME